MKQATSCAKKVLLFFPLNSAADQAEFTLWVVRYSSVTILFLLGLKAPGLPLHGYRALQSEDEEQKVFFYICWTYLRQPG